MSATVFAYDGSTHGDWVGRYAIRLAHAFSHGLRVVHVDEGRTKREIDERLRPLQELAAACGVPVQVQHVPRVGRSVASVLDETVPDEPQGIVVTGLRARESGRGLLTGTISERLLRSARHNVLAVRVVSPGLLGHAQHVMYAMSQNPRSARRSALFLRALAPEMTRLSLLTVFPPFLGRVYDAVKLSF